MAKILSKVGFDEMYGARPLKRAIQDKVEDLISEEVLIGNVKEGKPYKLKVEDETIPSLTEKELDDFHEKFKDLAIKFLEMDIEITSEVTNKIKKKKGLKNDLRKQSLCSSEW